jgi:hypothetical protein
MMLTLKPIHYASVWAMWMVEGIRQPVIRGHTRLRLRYPANDIVGHQIFFGIEDRFYPSSGLAVNDQR